MLPQHRHRAMKAQMQFRSAVQKNKLLAVKTEKHEATHDVQVATTTVRRTTGLRVIVLRINFARPICDMMFGENHKPVHRFAVGGCVAAGGVVIAKVFGHGYGEFLGGAADFFGYALHALGLTPFLEHIAAEFNKKKE